jgi:four helix bundle protein
VSITRLCQKLYGMAGVSRLLANQLFRSGTSVGANAEEAQAGQSRADFISKNSICLKEARETHFWLRLASAVQIENAADLVPLVQESDELRRIFGAIIVSAKRESS